MMRRDQPSGAIRVFSRRPVETNILMILLRGHRTGLTMVGRKLDLPHARGKLQSTAIPDTLSDGVLTWAG